MRIEQELSFEALKLRCRELGPTIFWGDNETHHGELQGRFQEAGVDAFEAALLATIQSGYWPGWLSIDCEELNRQLTAHCEEVAQLPNFGTTQFGGYFEDNWPKYDAIQLAADAAAEKARQAFAAAKALEESEGLSREARKAYVKAAGLDRKAAAAMRRLLAALPD